MKQTLAGKPLLFALFLNASLLGTGMASASTERLREMVGQDHLGTDSEVADPAWKSNLNAQIDAAALALAARAMAGASKSELFSEMGKRINAIDRDALDTEDAESVASVFEAMLEPLGLDSSEGILNTWMYGFDPL